MPQNENRTRLFHLGIGSKQSTACINILCRMACLRNTSLRRMRTLIHPCLLRNAASGPPQRDRLSTVPFRDGLQLDHTDRASSYAVVRPLTLFSSDG